jgi:hypothetical protein
VLLRLARRGAGPRDTRLRRTARSSARARLGSCAAWLVSGLASCPGGLVAGGLVPGSRSLPSRRCARGAFRACCPRPHSGALGAFQGCPVIMHDRDTCFGDERRLLCVGVSLSCMITGGAPSPPRGSHRPLATPARSAPAPPHLRADPTPRGHPCAQLTGAPHLRADPTPVATPCAHPTGAPSPSARISPPWPPPARSAPAPPPPRGGHGARPGQREQLRRRRHQGERTAHRRDGGRQHSRRKGGTASGRRSSAAGMRPMLGSPRGAGSSPRFAHGNTAPARGSEQGQLALAGGACRAAVRRSGANIDSAAIASGSGGRVPPVSAHSDGPGGCRGRTARRG